MSKGKRPIEKNRPVVQLSDDPDAQTLTKDLKKCWTFTIADPTDKAKSLDVGAHVKGVIIPESNAIQIFQDNMLLGTVPSAFVERILEEISKRVTPSSLVGEIVSHSDLNIRIRLCV